MCGIGGVLRRGSHFFSKQVLIRMLQESSDRGVDSTGIVGISDRGLATSAKVLGGTDALIESSQFEHWLEKLPEYRTILWNNRAQPIPEGDSIQKQNRQPVCYNGWWGTHNGTISNDKRLAEAGSLELRTSVDTEVALAALDKLLVSYSIGRTLVQMWASILEGGMALAAVNTQYPSCIYVIKNFKPLHIYCSNDYFVFASERKNIEAGFGEVKLTDLHKKIQWVPPYTGMIIDRFGINTFPIQTMHRTVLPQKDDKKAVVIASGGIDSSTAAAVALKIHKCEQVLMLHFDYGQIATEREMDAIDTVATALGPKVGYQNIDLRWMGKLVDTPLVSENVRLPLGEESAETVQCWVPARNLVMLSLAAAWCEARGYGRIYSGFNLEESGSYPDNDIEFLQQFNTVLSYGTLFRPRMVLALERLMKPEIIRLGTFLGVPFGTTWSCDRGGALPCGECGCCWTRQFAFLKAGIPDPQRYLTEPKEVPVWVGKNHSLNTVPLEAIIKKVRQTV